MTKLQNTTLTELDVLQMYREMVLIREFEETCQEMYTRGKIGGFLHLYSGEEAIGVGTIHALTPDDYVVSSYRDHGHCIMKGIEPKYVMAELFGRKTGICGGKGGSMHLFSLKHRMMGGYAIVAGGLPIAVGLAYAIHYLGTQDIVASFFGDGATNNGAFHEAFNMAKLWELPILFVCENNLYGIGTHVERASSVTDLHLRAKGHDIPSEQIDGMNVISVYNTVQRAVRQIREGGGPYFIEMRCYRFRGHSPADADEYRSKREIKIWKQRDPIPNLAETLQEDDMASAAELKKVHEEAKEIVAEAVRFADESPEPDEDDLMRDVYA